MDIKKLETIYEENAAGRDILTDPLRVFYGGGLSFTIPHGMPYVIGNFVKSIDGPVTFGKGNPNALFGHPQDRLIMSILRSWADVVIVGKDTLMDDPRDATWHWKTSSPKGAEGELAELYRSLGKNSRQRNLFVSGSGQGFDFSRGVFSDPDVTAAIATTSAGEVNIRKGIEESGLKSSVDILVLDDPKRGVDLKKLIAVLYEQGAKNILLEGGPALYGDFESLGLINEIFLSQKSVIAGNAKRDPRPTFTGHSYEPGKEKNMDLMSLKKGQDSMLFFRWQYKNS